MKILKALYLISLASGSILCVSASDYDFEISLFRKYYANTLLFNRFLTTMKQGGISNSGFRAKLNKTLEDIIVMRRNNINPIIGIIMKNLRKVNQLWNL